MRRKQGLRIVGMLVGIGAALFGVAIGLAPRERVAWVQTVPGANAGIVCVERPAAARDGDVIIVATENPVLGHLIALPERRHCVPYGNKVCYIGDENVTCF